MGKTIVEKILAKASGKKEVSPGEYVEVKIDTFVQVSSDGGGTPMQIPSRSSAGINYGTPPRW